MKNNYLTASFILFFTSNLFCQLNVDSLMSELSHFTQMKSSIGDNTDIEYVNKDSLRVALITYNSNGNITGDFYGIAIMTYKYDEKSRLIERISYDANGNYIEAELPAIAKIQYIDDENKEIYDYFDTKRKFKERWSHKYDTLGRVIDYCVYDNMKKLVKRTKYKYEKDGKIELKSEYDNENKLRIDVNGVAYIQKEYQTSKRNKVIEIQYLDSEMKPTSFQDNYMFISYSKAKYYYGLEKNKVKIEYYDKENNLLKEQWQYCSDN